MTIVAPTAMIAKKLASVAVWISVYEFRKLLTVAPLTGSTWSPASRLSATASPMMTSSRPACCERSRRLRTVMEAHVIYTKTAPGWLGHGWRAALRDD